MYELFGNKEGPDWRLLDVGPVKVVSCTFTVLQLEASVDENSIAGIAAGSAIGLEDISGKLQRS